LPTNSAIQTDLATPISRLSLYYHKSDYYTNNGDDNKSIKIKVNDKVRPIEDIVICDLTKWDKCSSIVDGKIGIDPKLGRISFSSSENPQDVKVSYYYGFSGEIGAGFYPRPEVDDGISTLISSLSSSLPSSNSLRYKVYNISKKIGLGYTSIQNAYDKWSLDGHPKAVFKIMDSEVYTDSIDLSLPNNSNLNILAESEKRPIIRTNSTVNITGESADLYPRASIAFDGLIFDKCQLNIQQGDLGKLIFRHCTIIPRINNTSLIVNSGVDDANNIKSNDNIQIILDHAITGPIDSSLCDGVLQISDSIIDGQWDTGLNCYQINVINSTVFGKVKAVIVDVISNSIFTSPIIAKRRQNGCVRFSYIPKGSKIPRHYRCQPEYLEGAKGLGKSDIETKITPRFTSMNFGEPGYSQLHKDTLKEIFEGADNGNEMGVFNHLYQASRIANLEVALIEYNRFGLETGVFNIT